MKTILSIIIVLVALQFDANAQHFKEIINTIEENNQQIMASQEYWNSQKLGYLTGIYPEGPVLGFGYFQNNETVPSDKRTIEIRQGFHLPGYYFKQKALVKEKMKMADFQISLEKQVILEEAAIELLRYVYLQKLIDILETRMSKAKRLAEAYQKKFDEGDIGKLEWHKSQLQLTEISAKRRKIQAELKSSLYQLKTYNGGKKLHLNNISYPDILTSEFDSVLISIKQSAPQLKRIEQEMEVVKQQVKAQKAENLPSFNIGYGSEKVGGQNFQGVLAGIAVPLWNTKNSIKGKTTYANSILLEMEKIKLDLEAEVVTVYHRFDAATKNLQELNVVWNQTKSDMLLEQMLEQGAISFLDYYQEKSYFYEMKEKLLEEEFELYRYQIQLQKYTW